MPHLTYIGAGSNLGDRIANLLAAIDALPPLVHPIAVSPVYETAPWGYSDQPDFLNQVFQAETLLPPHELLIHLKNIETSLGRTPTFRYGPRLIDLDILLYDHLVLETTGLTIPHPHLHRRAFALVPLADLAPDYLHPVLGQAIRHLLTEVDTITVHLYPSTTPPSPP